MHEKFKVFPFARWEMSDKGILYKGEMISYRKIRKIIFAGGDAGGFNGYLDVIKTDETSVFLYYSAKDLERLKNAVKFMQKMVEEVKGAKSDEEEFYLHMKANKISDLSIEADMARLKLFVQNSDLSEDEAVRLFTMGKESIENREISKYIEELKELENSIEQNNLLYKDLKGREKFIKYCEEMILMYSQRAGISEKAVSGVKGNAQKAYDLNKQLEHDAFLHGGIASGIAGGIAGAATFMKIQQKNEQIKASNDNLLASISALSFYAQLDAFRKLDNAKEGIKIFEEQKEKAPLLLLEEQGIDVLMSLLDVKVEEVEVLKTNSALVRISIKQPDEFNIFGNVPAFVDGVLKATLKAQGRIAGEVYFAVPYNGSKDILGVCSNVLVKAETYETVMEPVYLCAIEKTSVMHR